MIQYFESMYILSYPEIVLLEENYLNIPFSVCIKQGARRMKVCYASTVHKAKGSQIIILMSSQSFQICNFICRVDLSHESPEMS